MQSSMAMDRDGTLMMTCSGALAAEEYNQKKTM